MLIPYEIGGQVEAKVNMYVWVYAVNAVCLIVGFEKDVLGDEVMIMRTGEQAGPNEVCAKWADGLVAIE